MNFLLQSVTLSEPSIFAKFWLNRHRFPSLLHDTYLQQSLSVRTCLTLTLLLCFQPDILLGTLSDDIIFLVWQQQMQEVTVKPSRQTFLSVTYSSVCGLPHLSARTGADIGRVVPWNLVQSLSFVKGRALWTSLA